MTEDVAGAEQKLKDAFAAVGRRDRGSSGRDATIVSVKVRSDQNVSSTSLNEYRSPEGDRYPPRWLPPLRPDYIVTPEIKLFETG